MKLKSIFAIAVLAAGALAASAQATPTWTVTTQGTITTGFDTTGVFGTAGQDLAGLSYTQTITASVDPSQYGNMFSGPGFVDMSGSGGPGFTDTVTVNGQTVTFVIGQSAYAEQFLSDGASTNQYPYYDKVSTFQQGIDSGLNFVTAFNAANDPQNPVPMFVPTLDFSQMIAAIAGPDLTLSSSFSIRGSSLAYFDANPDSILVNGNGAPTDVPEPASIALLASGLAGIGLFRRRKAG